ncbi:hypothetical protein GCK72_007611 [Caenorhabditis remanei]|uniref:F-box domain-containing protein n=1 Tax=Caenorhabditis remanei TaxID=31234 RepID=A0A6A5HPC4_CAERE|nr:hypothetical protein GCK72_007611 [Caenorhabditis remanei]KAF1767652.1 hypothetical protein GCK72_007611 [Caenorhabditis remanei]
MKFDKLPLLVFDCILPQFDGISLFSLMQTNRRYNAFVRSHFPALQIPEFQYDVLVQENKITVSITDEERQVWGIPLLPATSDADLDLIQDHHVIENVVVDGNTQDDGKWLETVRLGNGEATKARRLEFRGDIKAEYQANFLSGMDFQVVKKVKMPHLAPFFLLDDEKKTAPIRWIVLKREEEDKLHEVTLGLFVLRTKQQLRPGLEIQFNTKDPLPLFNWSLGDDIIKKNPTENVSIVRVPGLRVSLTRDFMRPDFWLFQVDRRRFSRRHW